MDLRETDEPRVILETFRDLAPANIARGLLVARGIDATLQGDALIGIAWHLSNAVGGIKLLVPETQAADAKLVLASAQIRRPDEMDIAGDEPPEAEDAPGRAQPGSNDSLAEAAWRASLLGLLFLPPLGHLWSAWLLRDLKSKGGAQSARAKMLVTRAFYFNVAVLSAAAAVAARWLSERS